MNFMYGREIGELFETIDSYRLAHVTWGPDAANLSDKEISDIKTKIRNEFIEHITTPKDVLMEKTIIQVYNYISKAIKLTKVDFREPVSLSDDRRKINEIFIALDSSLMLLGNFVRNSATKTSVQPPRSVV